MVIRFLVALVFQLSFSLAIATAQAIPATASATLYFPHFVVGGNSSDYWVTSFDFANPYGRPVPILLYGQNDDGKPMSLRLGGQDGTSHSFVVPTNGSFTLASDNTPQAMTMGWVDVYSGMPVMGIATYTRYTNGIPISKITAESAQQTVEYLNIANRNLGLALANRNNFPITLNVAAIHHDGRVAGQHIVYLPAWGHTAFNLYGPMPDLPQDFHGTVRVYTPAGRQYFLAWSLATDASGVSSALPSGSFRRPVNQHDRIWTTYSSLLEAFDDQIGGAIPELNIIEDVAMGPNASARTRVGQVEEVSITLALAELLADSTDELAAALAHELGHIAQFRSGQTAWHLNPERDADVRGTLIALQAGYDPYALGGTLSKLSMASGQAGLLTQWETLLQGEIHGSFNDRLSNVYETLTFICSLPTVSQSCYDYRNIFHPHLPAAPLRRGGKSYGLYATDSPNVFQNHNRGPLQVDLSRRKHYIEPK